MHRQADSAKWAGKTEPVDPQKVALYIRWSTEDQGEGTTLDVQLDGCRHYALSQGWAVSEELTFIDDGHSGGSLDRPALTRLRRAVSRGDVDCVVVYKLDRLSRDVPDMIKLIMDEWDGTCYVKSAREPVDTTTQTGKMFFYTLASFAEWERSVIRDRTFSGKLRRAYEGKNPGIVPPYGYQRAESGGFALVPHEAEVVRRIYRLYRCGNGVAAVVSALNAEGIPFRHGRVWNVSTVKHMLNNPAYKGDLVYGVRGTDPRRKRRPRNPVPHVVRSGVFPVIIPAPEWDDVQEIKRNRPGIQNGGTGRGHASAHLLTGVLVCGNCGAHLNAAATRCGNTRYVYYACNAVSAKGRVACDSRRIRQEVLDRAVVCKLKELYRGQVSATSRGDWLMGALAAEEKAASALLRDVQERRLKVAEKRRKLRALVLEGRMAMEEYRAFAADVEAEAAGVQTHYERVQQRTQALKAACTGRIAPAEIQKRLDFWQSLTRAEQKEVVRLLVERIEAYLPRGGARLACSITWRVPGRRFRVPGVG